MSERVKEINALACDFLFSFLMLFNICLKEPHLKSCLAF